MGNVHYITQVEPVERESAFLFVPPSRFTAFMRYWKTLRVLPNDEFDALSTRLAAWRESGLERRDDPVEDAAMKAFLRIQEDYSNYYITLITHDIGSVRGVDAFHGVPGVNCCIVKIGCDHKMWCGIGRYIALLRSIAPFVDDAVIRIRDEEGLPENNQLLLFNAGSLTCTATDPSV